VQPQALVMDLKHPWAAQGKQIDGLLQVGLMIELLEVLVEGILQREKE